MGKIFMSSDWHFGVYPLQLNKWLNNQLEYFHKEMIPYLKSNVEEGDIFIMLGDLFDSRTSVPILVHNKVEDLLVEISKILPLHIIVGNHDLWNRKDTTVNSPKSFNWIPNVNIYNNTHTIDYNGKKLVLMPWVEKKVDMISEIKTNPGDYLFCHSDLNGCRMHLSSVAHRNPDKIEVDSFSGYNRVFSGHIHIRQVQKNFEFIGAPYQMDRNDYGDKKGMTILYPETGETKFIKNTISPEFKKFTVENDGDLLLLDTLDTSKNFVDLTIKNSTIVGNRKNRKLLEEILHKKKFASVENINDLAKNKKQPKLNENLDIDIEDLQFTDFSKTIVDYVDNQEMENTKFKNGVMAELDKLLNLYEKEYKFKSDS